MTHTRPRRTTTIALALTTGLVLTSCTLTGGGDDEPTEDQAAPTPGGVRRRGRRRRQLDRHGPRSHPGRHRHRGARRARLLHPPRRAARGLRGRHRLRPGGPALRRRGADGQPDRAHRRQPHRGRRLRHRHDLRHPGGRGRGARGIPARRPARVGGGARSGRGGRGLPHPRRLRRRVRQHRQRLVRQPGHRAAADPRRPHRPGLRGPLRHPGCEHLEPGPGVPARHHRRVRAGGVAGLLGGPHGQRRQGHQRLDRRLHRRLHRGRRRRGPPDRPVLRLQPALHHPRRRLRAHHPRAARHLLPAGGVRRCPRRHRQPRGGPGGGRLAAEPGGAGRHPGQHVRLPRRRRGRPCPTCGPSGRRSPRTRSSSARAQIEAERETWLREWADIATG